MSEEKLHQQSHGNIRPYSKQHRRHVTAGSTGYIRLALIGSVYFQAPQCSCPRHRATIIMEHTISFGERNAGLQVGVSNASITANFYSQQPERPETPPSPLSTVPFRRDPDFVEHGTLLDLIHEKCLAPASRIALVGLGGVG
jgi:hypothetical protein